MSSNEVAPTPTKKGHGRKPSFLPSFLTGGSKDEEANGSSSSSSPSGSAVASPEGSSPSLKASSSASREASPSPGVKRKGHARSGSTAAALLGTVRDAISTTSDVVTGFIPGLGDSGASPEVEVTFHSDEPPPPPVLPEDESLSVAQRVRNKCINEIISTEYLYARDLERIQEVFMTPIREQKLLDSSQMNAVFGGLSILLGMSRQMAKDLEVQVKKNGCVGSCFQGIAPYLKIYSQYCSSQQTALETLAKLSQANARLKSFLEEKQFSKQCGGQPLASYLSKPTQRLCKYPLLLRELLKNTPAGHPDKALVEEAARQIDVVVKSVNEARRRIEQSQVIYAIQARLDTQEHLLTPTRVFFKEGALRELVAGENFADVTWFIFNDLLLVCKAAGKKLAVQSSYPTAKLTCAALDESATSAALRNSFEIVAGGARRIFFTTTPELRTELLGELQRAIASETAADDAEGSVREDGSSHSHSSANTATSASASVGPSTSSAGADPDAGAPLEAVRSANGSRVPPPIPPKPTRTRPAAAGASPSPAAKANGSP